MSGAAPVATGTAAAGVPAAPPGLEVLVVLRLLRPSSPECVSRVPELDRGLLLLLFVFWLVALVDRECVRRRAAVGCRVSPCTVSLGATTVSWGAELGIRGLLLGGLASVLLVASLACSRCRLLKASAILSLI